MKDEIDVANFAFHQNDVGGVGDKGTEIRILFRSRQIIPRSSGEIVDNHDLVPLIQQVFCQMRTNKPGAPRYQVFHQYRPLI